VANEFSLAAASHGNIQRSMSAYEISNGNRTVNVEYVVEEVGDRQY
jgi:hypothetical protein